MALSGRRLRQNPRSFVEFVLPSRPSAAPTWQQTVRRGEHGKSSQGGVACCATPGAWRQELLSRAVACCNTGRYVTGRVLCPGLLQRRKCSAERWWHLLQDRPPFTFDSTWEGASWSTAQETPGRGSERELEVGLLRRRA